VFLTPRSKKASLKKLEKTVRIIAQIPWIRELFVYPNWPRHHLIPWRQPPPTKERLESQFLWLIRRLWY